jgi:hypothetical protein
MTDKKIKKQGFHEDVDPLLGKARKHSIVAQKTKFDREKISKEVAITPADDEQELKLHFKDSDKFVDTVFEFQEKYDTIIPLDFEEDRFVVSVEKEMVDKFRNFMKDKGLEEIPDAIEIDEKIDRVQHERSKLALNKDNAITASKGGNKENQRDLNASLAHPNLTDLENIDTANEKKNNIVSEWSRNDLL